MCSLAHTWATNLRELLTRRSASDTMKQATIARLFHRLRRWEFERLRGLKGFIGFKGFDALKGCNPFDGFRRFRGFDSTKCDPQGAEDEGREGSLS